EPDRKEGPAERGEDAGDGDCRVAHRVHGDADRVRGARMLAHRADAQADRRLEEDDVGEDDDGEHEPDEQAQVAEDVAQKAPDARHVAENVKRDLGDLGDLSSRLRSPKTSRRKPPMPGTWPRT